jgi:hypothetical protein
MNQNPSVACWRPAQESLPPNPISLLRVCELAEGPTVNLLENHRFIGDCMCSIEWNELLDDDQLGKTGPLYIHNRLNKEEPRALEILNGSTVQNRDRQSRTTASLSFVVWPRSCNSNT